MGFPEYFATADKYALPSAAALSGSDTGAGDGAQPPSMPASAEQQPEQTASGTTADRAADDGTASTEIKAHRSS